jgi:hypothetical protein
MKKVVAQNIKLLGKASKKEVKLSLPNPPVMHVWQNARWILYGIQLSPSLCIISPYEDLSADSFLAFFVPPDYEISWIGNILIIIVTSWDD